MKLILAIIAGTVMVATAPSDVPQFGDTWALPPFAVATCVFIGIVFSYVIKDDATDR
jgi:hypothetical protein